MGWTQWRQNANASKKRNDDTSRTAGPRHSRAINGSGLALLRGYPGHHRQAQRGRLEHRAALAGEPAAALGLQGHASLVRTVAKYMTRTRRPPSQGWKTFLSNHADGIASMDMFVVPTASFRLLYGLLILQHARRELVWLSVTAHPNAQWIAQQLTEAYGWREAPKYLIRDRDSAYGETFIRRGRSMGIRDRPTSARSPWQNGYAERLIGSVRRDCLDHVVVFGERHLRYLLASYQRYYNEARTHLSLRKDSPVPRQAQAVGRLISVPILGGLHHQYVRA
jgi:transposase InsO family protein